MKNALLSFVVLLLVACGGGSKDDDVGEPTPGTPSNPPFTELPESAGEGQTPEELDRSLAQPADTTTLDQIILPNGKSLTEYAKERGISLEKPKTEKKAAAALPATGPQQRKNDYISEMLLTAYLFSCGRDNPRCTTYDYDADATNTAFVAQKGLTYVYGSKTIEQRTGDNCGTRRTFGLDCSGLMYNIAMSVGLAIPTGPASTQGLESSWKFPADSGLSMKKVTDGTIEAGDIVVWSGHIGIAKTAGSYSSAIVISSLGGPGPDANQCTKNLNAGPRALKAEWIRSAAPTHVLRIAVDISGLYDLSIRCKGESSNAAVVRFTINNEKGGAFQAAGSGTDYTGDPLCFQLGGNYDQPTNLLSGTLSLCDNTRKDAFSVKLLEDTTTFFPLSKVVDNGQCPAEANLARVKG